MLYLFHVDYFDQILRLGIDLLFLPLLLGTLAISTLPIAVSDRTVFEVAYMRSRLPCPCPLVGVLIALLETAYFDLCALLCSCEYSILRLLRQFDLSRNSFGLVQRLDAILVSRQHSLADLLVFVGYEFHLLLRKFGALFLLLCNHLRPDARSVICQDLASRGLFQV